MLRRELKTLGVGLGPVASPAAPLPAIWSELSVSRYVHP